jgi:flavin reductase (DIM6/NTAB) family NADH-FMN oxidoreductase RutF
MTTGHTDTAALSAEVRRVHRRYVTGVTVVTTVVDGTPYGLAVNAFSSISLDPPLVLVCVARTAETYPRLFSSERFAVNILAHDQASVAAQFARSGVNKFAGLAWRFGEYETPLLDGVAAALELQVESRLPVYTHAIFIGRVLSTVVTDSPPLIYHEASMFDGGRLEPAPAPDTQEQP